MGDGLDSRGIADRQRRYGPNEIGEASRTTALRLLLNQFNNSLVWVLVFAAFVSGAILREWIDTSVIMAIVLLNAVLGFVQESRAEGALEALQAMSAPQAVVRRSGRDRRIVANEVVPGDVLLLEPGERVAADARLAEVVHLQLDESLLTGESFPIRKHCDPVDAAASTADRTNMVFAGTTVTAGRGSAIVTAIGDRTEFGKLADLLDVDDPPTPLMVQLDRVGKQIAVAAFVIASVMFAIGIARDIAAETMFLSAVALAVAAIPEGLSALVTVTLSRGVTAMARQNAIVRHLPAVETLGATTVICSDKTGTLTQNVIRVQELEFADLHASGITEVVDGRAARYAQIAALCNDARRTEGASTSEFIGDPTEVALLLSVDPVLVSVDHLRSQFSRIDEFEFESSRKMMSTLHRSPAGDGLLLMVKGAPESVIDRCSRYEAPSGVRSLSPERKRAATSDAERLAAKGLRTLALAYRPLDSKPIVDESAEVDLILVAIVGMSDAIRPQAIGSIERAHRAGIEVVMITGDHRVTAEAVGRNLGLLGPEHRVMTGAELRARKPEKLEEEIGAYRVFARVDPADKVAIVRAWKANGAIVAMTGDGVNDAPALQSADIGISMGSGTAVAREASDIVLADDNFSTIVAAVEQGRAIYANITKVIYFLLSANISEVMVMLVGFAVFGGLGEPLLATQLLWINLVTDGLPALALGADDAPANLMEQPPVSRQQILGRDRQRRLLWQGAVLAAGALSAFMYGYMLRGLAFDEARTLLFTALVLVQIPHTYNIRSEDFGGAGIRIRGNRFLFAASCVSLLLQLGVVYTPVGNDLFSTTPIAAVDWVALAILASATVFVIRAIVRRSPAPPGPSTLRFTTPSGQS